MWPAPTSNQYSRMSTSPAITDWDARELSRAIHAREVSCVEVMDAYLARIAAINPQVNALVSLRSAEVLRREAGVADAELAKGQSRGWMHGMPQAVKDLAHAVGLPTSSGSPLVHGFQPSQDSLAVARVRAAGAIFIGKTNVPEFGLGSHTFNEVFGPTRNPWDLSRSAGGSSGGAGAALAARLLPVADGSDFMGSLRNPGAWNHVFGLRPSQGRVPSTGALDTWVSQLPTEGPMGRTVADVAMLLHTQAGYDARAPLSLDDGARFDAALDGLDLRSVRIGWLGDLEGHVPTEPGILETCEQALARLQSMGCAVESTRFGVAPSTLWSGWLAWRQALTHGRLWPLYEKPENRPRMKPEAIWEIEQALQLTGPQFMQASNIRTAFHNDLLRLYERFDVLALPVNQCWPFDVTLRWPAEVAGRRMDTYHRWMEVLTYATFGGVPAISVPAGFGGPGGGLPCGLQLLGRPRGDWALLRLAHAYEQGHRELLARRPTLG